MRVVAVINRKGGSGKSTLATHLAGHCAQAGRRVMLGDVDQQHSSLAWLARRAGHPGLAQITGWAVDRLAVVRPPAGVTHVVLDTPGGLRGADLARAVFAADAVLIPVCASRFDRESALQCHAELMALPRVASGRCKVAAVGMRLHARTRHADDMPQWAAAHGLPYIGGVAGAEIYVRMADEGLTLFDLPESEALRERREWHSITAWLESTWAEADQAQQVQRTPMRPVDRLPTADRPELRERQPSAAGDLAPVADLAMAAVATAGPRAPAPGDAAAPQTLTAERPLADLRGDAVDAGWRSPARPARQVAPSVAPPRAAGALDWLYAMFRGSAAPLRKADRV